MLTRDMGHVDNEVSWNLPICRTNVKIGERHVISLYISQDAKFGNVLSFFPCLIII
jgi:hypothetical protein